MYTRMWFQKPIIDLIISGHISELEIEQIIFLGLFFHFDLHFFDLLFQLQKFLIFVLEFLFGGHEFIFFFENHSLALFLQLVNLLIFNVWWGVHLRCRLVQQGHAGVGSSYACPTSSTQNCIDFGILFSYLLRLYFSGFLIKFTFFLELFLSHDFIHRPRSFLIINNFFVLFLNSLFSRPLFLFHFPCFSCQNCQFFPYLSNIFTFHFLLLAGVQYRFLRTVYLLELFIFIQKLFQLLNLLFHFIFRINHSFEVFIFFQFLLH